MAARLLAHDWVEPARFTRNREVSIQDSFPYSKNESRFSESIHSIALTSRNCVSPNLPSLAVGQVLTTFLTPLPWFAWGARVWMYEYGIMGYEDENRRVTIFCQTECMQLYFSRKHFRDESIHWKKWMVDSKFICKVGFWLDSRFTVHWIVPALFVIAAISKAVKGGRLLELMKFPQRSAAELSNES